MMHWPSHRANARLWLFSRSNSGVRQSGLDEPAPSGAGPAPVPEAPRVAMDEEIREELQDVGYLR
jgi:hypothetical protein